MSDFLPLGVSFALSLLLVPLVRWVSFRTGRVAKPRKDRWHSQPTPTLGGVGMFLAFALTVVGLGLANGRFTELRWSLLAAAVIMFFLGLYDDFAQISPPAKLAAQLLAATLVIFFGEPIRFFPWPIANILLTFFWLAGITNAINLLDNMDGLAGGVSLIAAGFLSYFFWQVNDPLLLLLALAMTGAILGFLVFNFPPAKIFMGDSGSMFLGFTLAALAVARRTQASNIFAVVGVPTLVFLLPILDTTLVTVTRILRGQSPAQGGTDHTSHRLVAFGLTERQAVLTLYAVALISGVSGAALEALDYDLSLVVIPILLITLSLFAAYLARIKVVTPAANTKGALTRLMVDLTYKRRVFEMALDLMLVGVSYYLAYWTRFGLNMTAESMALFLRSWPLALASAFLSFFAFGVYRGVWRYVSVDDLLRYVKTGIGGAIPVAALLLALDAGVSYPPEVFVLFGLFLVLALAASRSSFQIFDRFLGRQKTRSGTAHVLLYGAEDAGELALRWILRNPQLGYHPLGFLDDDPLKWGCHIHGVDVLGGRERFSALLDELRVDGVILTASFDPESEPGAQLLAACRAKGVWVKSLRLEFETVG